MSAAAATSTAPPGGVTVNESRRKKEDNLAVIFMGFIIVFLVCHLPRLLLNIHELATIRKERTSCFHGSVTTCNKQRDEGLGLGFTSDRFLERETSSA